MVKDTQVRLLMKLINTEKTLAAAAAKAGNIKFRSAEGSGGGEMERLNIHEAKSKLSAVLTAVEQRGETFLICGNGKPVAV